MMIELWVIGWMFTVGMFIGSSDSLKFQRDHSRLANDFYFALGSLLMLFIWPLQLGLIGIQFLIGLLNAIGRR